MPTSILADDDEQIIADLQKDVRRLRSRLATTSPRGGHDAWTAAATPATTYQLSTIPVSGTCEFAINGHEQREGTDYTCDYSTGLVTVSASLSSGDKLVARYLVTDWLVARSLTPDTATIVAVNEGSSAGDASTPTTIAIPSGTKSGDLMLAFLHTANADTVPTTPTGWTKLGTPPAGGCLTVYSKIAGPSESTVAVTMTPLQHSMCFSVTFRASGISVQSALYATAGAVTSLALPSGGIAGDLMSLVAAWSAIGSRPTSADSHMTTLESGSFFVSPPALNMIVANEDVSGLTAIPSRTGTSTAAETSWTAAAIVVQST